jgi:cell division transport system permease protein
MHLFYIREAWRSFRQHRGLVYTAILSLTAALVVCGLFLMLTHNANVALQMIGDRREMVVYLRDGLTESQRTTLTQNLERLYGTVTYVSKDQAWEEFSQQVGDPSLLEAVDENPLPASLRVKLRPELLHYDAMQEAARQVSQFPEVEDVRYGAEWVRRLDELGVQLERGSFGVGLLVALAILFVIHNTIRLTVQTRRAQVEIMSRLGATDRFIATPFVYEAVLQTAVSALLALGLLFGFQQAIRVQIAGLEFLPPVWAAAFVVSAVMLAWAASLYALTRVLRAIGP